MIQKQKKIKIKSNFHEKQVKTKSQTPLKSLSPTTLIEMSIVYSFFYLFYNKIDMMFLENIETK
jgi:hypothetical protein